MKVELITIDPHQPEGMIVQVEEDVVEELLNTGHYKRPGQKVKAPINEDLEKKTIKIKKNNGKSYSIAKWF